MLARDCQEAEQLDAVDRGPGRGRGELRTTWVGLCAASDQEAWLGTLGTLDWLGMVTMHIQRPRMRRPFTALKLCDPPLTYDEIKRKSAATACTG